MSDTETVLVIALCLTLLIAGLGIGSCVQSEHHEDYLEAATAKQLDQLQASVEDVALVLENYHRQQVALEQAVAQLHTVLQDYGHLLPALPAEAPPVPPLQGED